MKAIIALFVLSFLAVFSAHAAKDELIVQFPQENGQYFLASTASEIGQYTYKKAETERAQALCEHLGFKKVLKSSSTILGVDSLKVNDLQDGKVVSLELKREAKYKYSYHHAVINDLHCSNVGEGGEIPVASLSNVGREIAIEKGTRNHSRIRLIEAGRQ